MWLRLVIATRAVHQADEVAAVMCEQFFENQHTFIFAFRDLLLVPLPPEHQSHVGKVVFTRQSEVIALVQLRSSAVDRKLKA